MWNFNQVLLSLIWHLPSQTVVKYVALALNNITLYNFIIFCVYKTNNKNGGANLLYKAHKITLR